MRDLYNAQLARMQDELIALSTLCENAISQALKGFMEGDKASAAQAIQTERMIDEKENEIEQLCLKLLLKQAPLAGDFRMISSVLKLITDLERIGDQAADIAELSQHTKTYHPTENMRNLSAQTIRMVKEAVDSFVKRDIAAAQAVIDNDDVVDDIFANIKTNIIAHLKDEGSDSEAVIDVLMIAKYLERVADHATNIAEWTIYSITGEHKD